MQNVNNNSRTILAIQVRTHLPLYYFCLLLVLIYFENDNLPLRDLITIPINQMLVQNNCKNRGRDFEISAGTLQVVQVLSTKAIIWNSCVCPTINRAQVLSLAAAVVCFLSLFVKFPVWWDICARCFTAGQKTY